MQDPSNSATHAEFYILSDQVVASSNIQHLLTEEVISYK